MNEYGMGSDQEVCERFRGWIFLEEDGELPEGKRLALAKHLTGCPGCAAFRDGFEPLRDGLLFALGSTGAVAIPPRPIAGGREAPRRRILRWWASTAAAAAVALFLLSGRPVEPDMRGFVPAPDDKPKPEDFRNISGFATLSPPGRYAASKGVDVDDPAAVLDYLETFIEFREDPPSLPEERIGEVDRLVERLSSVDWREREEATQALVVLGPAVLPHLEGREEGADPETRLRLQQVVREAGADERIVWSLLEVIDRRAGYRGRYNDGEGEVVSPGEVVSLWTPAHRARAAGILWRLLDCVGDDRRDTVLRSLVTTTAVAGEPYPERLERILLERLESLPEIPIGDPRRHGVAVLVARAAPSGASGRFRNPEAFRVAVLDALPGALLEPLDGRSRASMVSHKLIWILRYLGTPSAQRSLLDLLDDPAVRSAQPGERVGMNVVLDALIDLRRDEAIASGIAEALADRLESDPHVLKRMREIGELQTDPAWWRGERR